MGKKLLTNDLKPYVISSIQAEASKPNQFVQPVAPKPQPVVSSAPAPKPKEISALPERKVIKQTKPLAARQPKPIVPAVDQERRFTAYLRQAERFYDDGNLTRARKLYTAALKLSRQVVKYWWH